MTSCAAKIPIPIDTGLLLAVERTINGSNCHKLRNALNAYQWACDLGKEEIAQRAEQELYALLAENGSAA